MPLISIVVPVYKVEKYIVSTIRSLCEQTFSDYEIVLVDDGSPDASIELAEKELQKYPVSYQIIRQKNQGVSAARNHGIQAAKGQWFICIDSDDELHPCTVQLLANVIKSEPQAEVVGINLQVTHTSGITEKKAIDTENAYRTYTQEGVLANFSLNKIRLFAPGLLIKKSFLEQHGLSYRQGVRYSEDLLFVWYVLAHVHTFCYIEEKLYYYLRRPESTMTASSTEKILSGYEAFKTLDSEILSGSVQLGQWASLILPRWVIAVLHSVAKYMDYKEFKNLAEAMDYRKMANQLLSFPQRKIAALAVLLRVCPYAYYLLMKIV